MSISKSSLSLFLIFVFVEKRKKKTLQQFSILIPHLLTIGILPIFVCKDMHTSMTPYRFSRAFFSSPPLVPALHAARGLPSRHRHRGKQTATAMAEACRLGRVWFPF